MAAGELKKAALVGEIEAPVDERLVNATVTFIRKTLEETTRKGMLEVGAYLLKEFYDDNLEEVQSRNPKKRASVRRLGERCGTFELPVSKTWLNDALRLAMMTKALPATAAFKRLPQSHQVALLPLRKPERAETVAKRVVDRVVEKEFSVRELRGIVHDEVVKNKGDLGRPNKPRIVKALDHSIRVFTLEAGKRRSFTKAEVADLSEEQADQARAQAEKLTKTLKELIDALKKK